MGGLGGTQQRQASTACDDDERKIPLWLHLLNFLQLSTATATKRSLLAPAFDRYAFPFLNSTTTPSLFIVVGLSLTCLRTLPFLFSPSNPLHLPRLVVSSVSFPHRTHARSLAPSSSTTSLLLSPSSRLWLSPLNCISPLDSESRGR